MTTIVRYYGKEDLEAVKRLHEKQGLGYTLPDLEDPSTVVRIVMEEDGQITQALFLRKASEAFWLFDREGKRKRDIAGRFIVLHKEAEREAARCGIPDVYAWIPPQIAGNMRFDRMMRNKLGWDRPLWPCFHRSVGK